MLCSLIKGDSCKTQNFILPSNATSHLYLRSFCRPHIFARKTWHILFRIHNHLTLSSELQVFPNLTGTVCLPQSACVTHHPRLSSLWSVAKPHYNVMPVWHFMFTAFIPYIHVHVDAFLQTPCN